MKGKLVDSGIFFALVENLGSSNVDLVENCLRISEGLIAIQKLMDSNDALVYKDSGCLDKVEILVYRENEK